MKVLLISPTFTARIPKHYKGRPALYEPLGLAYLAAALREANHEPIILDCVAEGWQTSQPAGEMTRIGLCDAAIEGRIAETKPDLIGITFQFTGFDADGKRIAGIAKRTLPDVPVIIGGADASARSEQLVQEPNIDLVVCGEGDRVIVEIANRLSREDQFPANVPGTVTKSHANPPQDLVEDLDTLPMPARDLLPMATYLEDQYPIMPYAKRTPIGFLMSSRGCPYNCIFCSTTKVWRRKWRPRGPESVVDEIELLVTDYGVREIAFQDDSFLVDLARVKRICEGIIARGLDISWTVPPGLAAWQVEEDLLHVMRDSGFYRACFPIESGDPAILKFIRKPIDLDKVRETIRICNKLGIWTYGNFIIGFPEQTGESIEMTAEFALDSGLDMISVYIAQPYAGSDMYNIYEQLGLLDVPGAEASTVFSTRYDTKHFTAEELCAKRDEIYKRFVNARLKHLCTPSGLADLVRKTNSPGKLAYATRILKVMLKNSLAARKPSLLF